ncbi:MAG: hypothetical protein KDA31_03000 [Phycisphaerales bacterium]|nr:hypothetical protein [Phycisphaerales bacterium]MCB9836538.1 hypothetical protein [Phycisphaera sp.]
MLKVQAIASIAGTLTALGAAAQPEYMIIDLGVVNAGDAFSQGLGISPGGVAVGRSLGVSNAGFTWTQSGGIVALSNLPGRAFNQANDANANGQAVGTATTTTFGSGPLPVIWNGTTPTQLPLPVGEGAGRAWGINNNGIACGSVGGGTTQFASYWDNTGHHTITATTTSGAFMVEAFEINDAGQIVGHGIDPSNLARNVGLMYDLTTGVLTEIDALPGQNGTIAFGLSESGVATGSSSFNQSGGLAFMWDAINGSSEIPLPAGATTASGRGANSSGWVVGNAGGVFAVPWLFDGSDTYRIQDLIDPGSGWDLSMNTSSSAVGISEDGTIVGTGLFNGQTHGYAAVLVPAPASGMLIVAGGLLASRRRR